MIGVDFFIAHANLEILSFNELRLLVGDHYF